MPEARRLCVVVHDVAPATWDACTRVLQAVQDVAAVPLTLLAVPAWHGRSAAVAPGFEARLSSLRDADHELALHGYFHRDAGTPRTLPDWLRRRIYTAGEGEFCALTEEEAAERLQLGQRWFAANGWPLVGFVPPAWLLSAGAWRALRRSSLAYVATLRALHPLPAGPSLPAPSLSFSARAAWRRTTSLACARLLRPWRQSAALLRIDLHPHDADYPPLRRCWQHALADALNDRQVMTLARAVAETARATPGEQEKRWATSGL
jgi:predicted deacetylase